MKKMMKKMVATALSATMVFGMSISAFASNPSINIGVVGGDENVNVATLTVPSSYAMALNPNQMDVVPVSGTAAVSGQIVSRDFAFLNKTPKDVVVTLELQVTAPKAILFVDSVSGYTSESEYAIHLQAVPAAVSGSGTVNVVSGSGSAAVTIDTTAAELSKASITPVSGAAVTLDAAGNTIDFMLEKATSGGKYMLDDNGNIVKTESVTSAMGSKGAAGFTFQGEVNANADWSQLKAAGGIKIVPVYSAEIVNDAETVVGDTNMVESKFSSSTPWEITFTENGTKKTDVKAPTAVHVQYQGQLVDITKNVTLATGKITISDADIKKALGDEGSSARVKVVYTTQSGRTKVATVNVATN